MPRYENDSTGFNQFPKTAQAFANNGLTSSYTLKTVSLTVGPKTVTHVFLQGLHASWSGADAEVATIDWHITYDAAGDKIILRSKQSTAVTGQTGIAYGGVQETVEVDLVTDGNLYVWIKTNSPTATLTRLFATAYVRA